MPLLSRRNALAAGLAACAAPAARAQGAGPLRIRVPGQAEEVIVAVSGGLMEVQPDAITVLADVAVRGDEIDEARAEAAKKAAEAALEKATDDRETAAARQALKTAIAELKALDYLRRRVH